MVTTLSCPGRVGFSVIFMFLLTRHFFLAERLNNVEPQKMVNSKSIKVPRERLLRPWFHSPLSRYQSSLMFRKTWEIHYLKKTVKYSIKCSSLQIALVVWVWSVAGLLKCVVLENTYLPYGREFFLTPHPFIHFFKFLALQIPPGNSYPIWRWSMDISGTMQCTVLVIIR